MVISQLNILTKIGKNAKADRSGANLAALTSLLSTIDKPGEIRSLLVAHVLYTAIEFIETVFGEYYNRT